jgi:hypothetical protein
MNDGHLLPFTRLVLAVSAVVQILCGLLMIITLDFVRSSLTSRHRSNQLSCTDGLVLRRHVPRERPCGSLRVSQEPLARRSYLPGVCGYLRPAFARADPLCGSNDGRRAYFLALRGPLHHLPADRVVDVETGVGPVASCLAPDAGRFNRRQRLSEK